MFNNSSRQLIRAKHGAMRNERDLNTDVPVAIVLGFHVIGWEGGKSFIPVTHLNIYITL